MFLNPWPSLYNHSLYNHNKLYHSHTDYPYIPLMRQRTAYFSYHNFLGHLIFLLVACSLFKPLFPVCFMFCGSTDPHSLTVIVYTFVRRCVWLTFRLPWIKEKCSEPNWKAYLCLRWKHKVTLLYSSRSKHPLENTFTHIVSD